MKPAAFAFVADDLFEQHAPPGAHPERPQRLAAVRAAIERAGVAATGLRLPPRAAEHEELVRVHGADYLHELAQTAGMSGFVDGDTYYVPASWEIARAAAGATIDLTRAVVRGDATRGFAAVRPPGHHAEADRAMGFCLINNVAIAAACARADGLERVAIVDWDVHHGNGTQHIFEADPSVLFVSLHEAPLYPGTGAPSEVGRGRAAGSTVNVALPAGCGDADYARVFEALVLPALRRFAPELILVSAGFDAHASDPLAHMRVTEEGFATMAEDLAAAADALCGGRLVLVLEGGYHLEALRLSVGRVLEAIEPGVVPGRRPAAPVRPGVNEAIEATRRALADTGVELEAP